MEPGLEEQFSLPDALCGGEVGEDLSEGREGGTALLPALTDNPVEMGGVMEA